MNGGSLQQRNLAAYRALARSGWRPSKPRVRK